MELFAEACLSWVSWGFWGPGPWGPCSAGFTLGASLGLTFVREGKTVDHNSVMMEMDLTSVELSSALVPLCHLWLPLQGKPDTPSLLTTARPMEKWVSGQTGGWVMEADRGQASWLGVQWVVREEEEGEEMPEWRTALGQPRGLHSEALPSPRLTSAPWGCTVSTHHPPYSVSHFSILCCSLTCNFNRQ